jgi:hypothetical protein
MAMKTAMSPSPDIARSHIVARELEDRLVDAFKKAGWRADLKPAGIEGRSQPDMVVHLGPHRYVVEVKVAREPRRPLLQAMFADAVLQARVHARELHAAPLAVVAAPRISPLAAQEIRDYAERFAEDVAWGLLDSNGCFELHGPGLDAIHSEPAKNGEPEVPLSRPPPDLFSDLGQWMLKVFMADHIEPMYLGAPRGPIRNASHLASLASVSLPSASRLLNQLKGLHFIESAQQGPYLVRIADLMQGWRVSNSEIPHEIGARWLIPPKDGAAQLSHALAARSHLSPAIPEGLAGDRKEAALGRRRPRACLGLFAASEKLGFRFAHGAPLHLYLEDISGRVLEQFGLSPAGVGERVDVFVRRPRNPEAVFRACVVRDGIPAADIIQCWLDISNHPARGREHAEQIWRRVLAPSLKLGQES